MAKGGPDLKRYMDKNLSLKLNGNRIVKVSAHERSLKKGISSTSSKIMGQEL